MGFHPLPLVGKNRLVRFDGLKSGVQHGVSHFQFFIFVCVGGNINMVGRIVRTEKNDSLELKPWDVLNPVQ